MLPSFHLVITEGALGGRELFMSLKRRAVTQQPTAWNSDSYRISIAVTLTATMIALSATGMILPATVMTLPATRMTLPASMTTLPAVRTTYSAAIKMILLASRMTLPATRTTLPATKMILPSTGTGLQATGTALPSGGMALQVRRKAVHCKPGEEHTRLKNGILRSRPGDNAHVYIINLYMKFTNYWECWQMHLLYLNIWFLKVSFVHWFTKVIKVLLPRIEPPPLLELRSDSNIKSVSSKDRTHSLLIWQ